MKSKIDLKENLKTLYICLLGGLGSYLICYIYSGTLLHYLILTILYMFFIIIMFISTFQNIIEKIEEMKK